jgi:hypothetical protein
MYRLLRIFYESQSGLAPLRLLFSCEPLCRARSWWAALRRLTHLLTG